MSAPPRLAPHPPAVPPGVRAERAGTVPAPVTPARPATAPLLATHVARLIGFVGLAMFGALQWAQMVRPAASGALLGSVLVAAIAGALLAAVARRRAPARARIGALLLAGAVLLVLALALALAGVAGRFFGPRGWDDLAGGIGQGLGAVSTVRTPYGGLDEWTRIVIVLGGCLLAVVAALLAFAPRRRGAFGYPAAAAAALGALYTVPVMQHDIRIPFLAGLAFALLLATFLWLERVERRNAGPAAALIAVAALGGYVAAPQLDGERALLDYEEIAQSLGPAASTQYRWNHDYGPLDWPRDGREVLRIDARERSYWKATNLVAFDGVRWVQDTGQASTPLDTHVFDPRWVQSIRVTLRALRTAQFIGAGTTLEIRDSPRTPINVNPGVFESAGEPLRRGHAYRAIVYTPRPSPAQLRAAGSDYDGVARDYGVVDLPASAGSGGAGPRVVFPWWNEPGLPAIIGTGRDATAVLDGSPYERVYALAQRLRADSSSPFDYVRRVERYLADGFTYSETPPPSRVPLADFLLRDRVGYCQQFSGAMALLLRMGGVPARVATGFSPGSVSEERREYVVRDTDAHSWVEVFMPGIGWVTRDPTPAASPARAQIADLADGGSSDPVTFSGSERALGRSPDAGTAGAPATTVQDEEDGVSVLLVGAAALLALVAVVCAAVALRAVRRRRRRDAPSDGDGDGAADLAELRRALERSGRAPPPQLTLAGLAARLGGTAAESYVRTLADARYGYGGARPSRAQRAALRRELGAGLGLRGRLRAWWALPPG